MAQQINLCTPVLRTPRRAFSAVALLQALALLVLLGGALGGYLAWSLQQTSESLQRTLASNQQERDSLRAAIAAQGSRRGASPEALAQQLQSLRTRLQQREALLEELHRGRPLDGMGHAARLQLVAQTIPARVWVTQLVADERLLEVQGYALEPSDLNDWIARLGQHPLLAGQRLSTVKVERAAADFETLRVAATPAAHAAPASALAAAPTGQAPATRPSAASAAAAGLPVWRFTLTCNAIPRLPASAGKAS